RQLPFSTPRPPRSTPFPYTTLFRSYAPMPGREQMLRRCHPPCEVRGAHGIRVVVRQLVGVDFDERDAVLRQLRPLLRPQPRLQGSEGPTSDFQPRENIVCGLWLEKK